MPIAPPPAAPAPPPAASGAERKSGLNYVVIQAVTTEAAARQTVEMLKKEGIAATVEQNLGGWAAKWFCIVSTQGFARIGSPEYTAYLRQIRAINDKHSDNEDFVKLSPQPYRWPDSAR